MPYRHLTPSERGQIQAYSREGMSQSAIAERLGRHRGTISRELHRNNAPARAYDAERAQKRYVRERKACVRQGSLDHLPLRRYVIAKLHEGWSPEQVSGRLWRDFPGQPRMRVSHEAIYQSIYRDDTLRHLLVSCLRRRRPRRKKRGERRPVRPVIPNKLSIEARPRLVDEEARHGDWEGDLVLGSHQDGALLTLVDRKSLYLSVTALASKEAAQCAQAMTKAFKAIHPKLRQTLTLDNGTEFFHHERVAEETGLTIYFAHPYAPHERGRIENANGLLRQYYPKKTSFAELDTQQLRRIVEEINNRPRKKLGYRTPNEVLKKQLVALQP